MGCCSAPDPVQAVIARIASARPTGYRIVDGGASFYVHCALDAMIYTASAGRRILVEVLRAGEQAWQATLDPEDPREDLYISTVAVECLEGLPEDASAPSKACRFRHFFKSAEEFLKWRSSLEERLRGCVDMVSVRSAWSLARDLASRLLSSSR